MNALIEISDDAVDAKANATWKFDFLDTVNADPKASGACLAVLKAYLHFASSSKPRAFCALPELMLRTGGSKPRVLRAKALLEKLGYLVPLYVTDEGATMYRLVNARKQIIDEHLHIARQSLAAERRDRKRRERAQYLARGSNETIPPEFAYQERNDTPVSNETIPNSLDEYPRGYISEQEKLLVDGSDLEFAVANSYANASGDDLDQPLPIPNDEWQVEETMDAICMGRSVHPIVRNRLRSMLMDGLLSPARVENILGTKREQAA